MENRVLLTAGQDFLYIGDQGDLSDASDDTVKRFDATTGAFVDSFVAPNAGGLNGPRGMVFNAGNLLVANQNVDQTFTGEVLRFDGKTGDFVGAIVPADNPPTSTNPDAPFAPRGIVVKDGVLYVADLEGSAAPDGRIARYDVNSGAFLGDLLPSTCFASQFNPRAVVFGPDGKLYVSVFDTTNPMAGHVLRFDTFTGPGPCTVIATNNGDATADPGETADLHRPEGLVFGPDGKLYVTSFRKDISDNDKILVIDVATGLQTDKFDLDVAGGGRAFAQAIEFGPRGKLFVPISGNGPDTGSVRAYDVATKTYTEFVSAGGDLVAPWYLTFGQTNAATLAYIDPGFSYVDANNNGAYDHGLDVPLTTGELADGKFSTTKTEGGYSTVIAGAGLVINDPVTARRITFTAAGDLIVNADLTATARDVELKAKLDVVVLPGVVVDAARDVEMKASPDYS